MAQVAPNDAPHLAAQCREIAAFLCQPINETTDVQRLVANAKEVSTWRKVPMLPVQTESCSFLLDRTVQMSVYHFRRRADKEEKQNFACTPPNADAIRQYLCPNIGFTEPLVHHFDGVDDCGWLRKENGVLIEAESLRVVTDPRDGSCLEYFNSVSPKPVSIHIPDGFDPGEWTPKVKDYVARKWDWLARKCLRALPARFRPELLENETAFVYTRDGLLVYRFPFDVQDLRPSADGARIDVGQLWIEVDVAKREIIRPQPAR
jgi:hypothetical protein